MIKNLKKAFTIIELVIVIAVIAILAAVMIPTYSSLVDKANQSADIQAVKQMNTILSTYVDGSITNIADAKIALDKDGIDANNYKPLTSGYEFYWEKELNRIVMADSDNSVFYPENLKNKANETNFVSLSGNGEKSATEKLIKEVGSQSTVVLEDTNFMGASINIDLTGNNASQSETGLIIGGENKENPTTLENFVSDEGSKVATNEGYWATVNYFPGLIQQVQNGQTVTVQNLVIDGAVIGDTTNPSSGHVGIIAGDVSSGGTLIIKNVTIDNCVVFGEYMVGALIGNVYGGATVEIENVTVRNTIIRGCSQTALLIGTVYNGANVTFKDINIDYATVIIEMSDYNNTNATGPYTDIRTNDNGNKYITCRGNEYAYLTNEYVWLNYDNSLLNIDQCWETKSVDIKKNSSESNE